jgi:hypothetical protein
MLQCVSGLLRVTAKHNVHIILTAHEDEPTMKKNDRGMATDVVEYITIMLGGKLVGNMSYRLSEIWLLSNTNNRRYLAVWPNRMRKPMKTRMFATTLDKRKAQVKEFPLTYDAEKPDEGQPHTISKWYADWIAAGQRIPIPYKDGEED